MSALSSSGHANLSSSCNDNKSGALALDELARTAAADNASDDNAADTNVQLINEWSPTVSKAKKKRGKPESRSFD